MLTLEGVGLTGDYERFRRRQIKHLIDQIPLERRSAVLEQIQMRQCLLGDGCRPLLNIAAKHLKETP